MKKEAILILLIILMISSVKAVEYSCPSQNDLSVGSKEIDEGKSKSILGVPLGVCGAIENSVQNWIEAQIFIDANTVIIYGTNSTAGTELSSSNDTVSLTSTGSDKATISIAGTSGEIDVGDCTTIGSFSVLLKSISGSGTTAEVNLLVGKEKIILNTLNQKYQIIDFNSKKYALELFSGSHTHATLKAATCSSGDVTAIELSVNLTGINETNETQNTTNATTQNNGTETNQTLNETAQIEQQEPECPNIGLINDIKYCDIDGFYKPQKKIDDACYKSYECLSDYCKESVCAKKSFFKRIADFFRNLFG